MPGTVATMEAPTCQAQIARIYPGEPLTIIAIALQEKMGENLRRNILKTIRSLAREMDHIISRGNDRYLLIVKGLPPLGASHLYRNLLQFAYPLGGLCRFARVNWTGNRSGLQEQLGLLDRQLDLSCQGSGSAA